MVDDEDITCRELIELVTAYLDGVLAPADQARFERHLSICTTCGRYLEQMRATIAASGRLTPEQLDPATQVELVTAFRGWRAKPDL